MPRYFLHVCNGNGFTEDEEGLELPDAAAARLKAVEGLRDIMAGELRSGTLNMASFIEIEDEQRELILTVSFRDAVQIESRQGTRLDK